MENSNTNTESLGEMARWINGLPELKQALDIISDEIRRLSSSRRVTAEAVQILGSYLTQARLLMNDLHRSGDGADSAGNEKTERYVQFESLIRSLRKELDRLIMRIDA